MTFPYGHDHGLRELVGTTVDLTEEERATREALRDEYGRLEAEYSEADELPDEVDQRFGEIEEALEAFDRRPMIYAPEQIARAGAFVSIDSDGTLLVERGYVRPEDEGTVEPEGGDSADDAGTATDGDGVQRAVIAAGGSPTETDDEEDEVETIRPLPDRLVSELTAHRTLALRDAVASSPHVAMTALLHRLVTDTFLPHSTRGCIEAQVREVHFPAQAEDLRDSASARSVAERHERWGDHIPADDAALWDWLADLDDDSRMELLAHCVSFGVNALYEKPNPYGGMGVSQHGLEVRLAQADRFREAVREGATGERGRLRVGFVGSATFELLPRIIPEFRRRYPLVELVLQEAASATIADRLIADELDVGLVRLPLLDAAAIDTTVIDRDELHAALPENSPFAKAGTVELADLAKEPFVLQSRISVLHSITLSACQKEGFVPIVAQEAEQLSAILSLVRSGLGVALVPARVAHAMPPGLRLVPLARRVPIETGLALPRGETTAIARNFAAIAINSD